MKLLLNCFLFTENVNLGWRSFFSMRNTKSDCSNHLSCGRIRVRPTDRRKNASIHPQFAGKKSFTNEYEAASSKQLVLCLIVQLTICLTKSSSALLLHNFQAFSLYLSLSLCLSLSLSLTQSSKHGAHGQLPWLRCSWWQHDDERTRRKRNARGGIGGR